MKEEIAAGIKNAVERGSSLEQAKQSFINAGYNANDVEEAANELSGVITQYPQLTQSSEESISQSAELSQPPQLPKQPPSMQPPIQQTKQTTQLPPQLQQLTQPQYQLQQPQQKPKSKKILIIIIVLAVILILLVGLLAVIFSEKGIIDFITNLFPIKA